MMGAVPSVIKHQKIAKKPGLKWKRYREIMFRVTERTPTCIWCCIYVFWGPSAPQRSGSSVQGGQFEVCSLHSSSSARYCGDWPSRSQEAEGLLEIINGTFLTSCTLFVYLMWILDIISFAVISFHSHITFC